MANAKQKKQAKHQFIDKNPVEAFKDLGAGVVNSFMSDVGKGMASDLWDQMLGTDRFSQKETSGDLTEGEELQLSRVEGQKEAPQLNIEPGIDYRREVIHGETRIAQENTRELEIKIQEIIIELKKLTTSSKELQVQFKEIAVEQMPVEAGKYHLSFFEWVISQIRKARMRVENSSTWLALFKSKKNQRQYWAMFKKHGTTFGLSNERVVATQTG